MSKTDQLKDLVWGIGCYERHCWLRSLDSPT